MVLPSHTSDNKLSSKNKCYTCNKKLNLIQIEISKCKCEHVFCDLHRFPETHQCSEITSIINEYREKLKLNLEKVENCKIIKI